MASKDLQSLLRFLSQTAKLPLSTALSRAAAMQQAGLMTPDAISKASIKDLEAIFPEDNKKFAKQVLNAAKRVGKKRAASSAAGGDDDEGGGGGGAPVAKKGRKGRLMQDGDDGFQSQTPAELEASLALPYAPDDLAEEELAETVVFTNRAPLVLAFAVTLLKYTMPGQPVSSRLSLAHAYVSVSSRGRAVDLGIERGASAEEEGWGKGQPVVRIMGRDIHVMRRAGYDPREGEGEVRSGNGDGKDEGGGSEDPKSTTTTTTTTTTRSLEGADGSTSMPADTREMPLWGLDLEALRSSNRGSALAGHKSSTMPIQTPQSARTYLLKAAGSDPNGESGEKGKKKSAAVRNEENEKRLGMLLKAIDLVYKSWEPHIGPAGLDNRTWGWYASVRPEIAHGKEGWGAKNEVKLSKILALQRK